MNDTKLTVCKIDIKLISNYFTGLPEVQMRHKNRSKESNAKGDFVEASNQSKGEPLKMKSHVSSMIKHLQDAEM